MSWATTAGLPGMWRPMCRASMRAYKSMPPPAVPATMIDIGLPNGSAGRAGPATNSGTSRALAAQANRDSKRMEFSIRERHAEILAQRRAFILGAKQTAALQFRHDQI